MTILDLKVDGKSFVGARIWHGNIRSATAFLTRAAPSQATCLVVDIQLGDISGVELARQLAVDGIKYPIIFMTALDDERISKPSRCGGRHRVPEQAVSGTVID